MKFDNGPEYYGKFKNDRLWGEGVLKDKGKLYSVKYEQDKLISYT